MRGQGSFLTQCSSFEEMPSKRKLRTKQHTKKKQREGQFKGRKERLRAKNLDLEKKIKCALEEKVEVEKKKTELDHENTIIKR